MVKKFVKGRFDRAAGKQHVIDQNHGGALHIPWNDRGGKFLGDRIAPDVVPVKGDIQGAHPFDLESGGQAPGEFDAAIGDPEQND